MTGDARDWQSLLTGFLSALSFNGLLGASLIGPHRRCGSTESETCNVTYDAVLSWPVPLMARRVLTETAFSISEHKKTDGHGGGWRGYGGRGAEPQ